MFVNPFLEIRLWVFAYVCFASQLISFVKFVFLTVAGQDACVDEFFFGELYFSIVRETILRSFVNGTFVDKRKETACLSGIAWK